jgi:transcriptional regulator with PAS, ATPase and Fis domain
MVLDSAELHRPRLERIIAHCGATPMWLRTISEVGGARARSRANVLLIALENELSPNAPVLDAMHSLKGSGLSILAFADGIHNWPIRTRCFPLVAGASNLLDSSTSDFESELFQLLVQLFQAEARQEEDERCIKATMIQAGIVGESQSMLGVFRTVLRVSVLSDLPILLTGETGTGKELFAHAIHALDPKRRTGPFIAVNCGAISVGLAESELFGHRRGAFTGAERDRKGLIRAAEGGVVFLDEIGELDETLQVKLLRVLQERRVLAVGVDQEVPVSVRVIAATNRNLSAAVQHGTFRTDLFHRLNVLSIHIPSLRERHADVGPLIEHLLEKNHSLQTAGPVSAGPDFIEALTRIDLPGNVRQLENLVRRALVNKLTSTPLTLNDLPAEVWQQLAEQEDSYGSRSEQSGGDNPAKPAHEPAPQTLSSDLVNLLDSYGCSLAHTLRYCERILLEAALRRKQGNQSQTARLLGLTPRSIYSKMRRHHLNKL